MKPELRGHPRGLCRAARAPWVSRVPREFQGMEVSRGLWASRVPREFQRLWASRFSWAFQGFWAFQGSGYPGLLGYPGFHGYPRGCGCARLRGHPGFHGYPKFHGHHPRLRSPPGHCGHSRFCGHPGFWVVSWESTNIPGPVGISGQPGHCGHSRFRGYSWSPWPFRCPGSHGLHGHPRMCPPLFPGISHPILVPWASRDPHGFQLPGVCAHRSGICARSLLFPGGSNPIPCSFLVF